MNSTMQIQGRIVLAPRVSERPKVDLGLLVTLTMRRADRVQPHFCGTSAQAILKNLGGFCSMAKLVFGMNQSLDGYVDHLEFRPSPALFRHFIEQVRDLTGSVYGFGTKTARIGARRNTTSRRRGGASRSGLCRAR